MTQNTPYGVIQYSTTPDVARHISQTASVYFTPKFSARNHATVKAQPAFLKAYHEAEKRYGKRTRKPKLPRRLRPARAILITGIGWRDYDQQYAYWRSDPNRYAPPWSSGHVQGFAVDIDMNQDPHDLNLIFDILYDVGFRRARSDEPWHWTLGPVV